MKSSHRLPLIALCVLVVVHVMVTLSLVHQPLGVRFVPPQRSLIWPLHYDTVHRAGPGSDFFAVYHAGVQVAREQNPYLDVEWPRVTPAFYSFRYLPVVAETLGLTAIRLSPMTAYHAWIAVIELSLALCLAFIWRRVRAPGWRVALATALLLSSPYFLELHMGQFTFVTVALLTLGLCLLEQATRPASASGVLAFTAAALLKVFPLVSVAAMLRHRRGRLAAATAGVFLVVTSVPTFVAHPDLWRNFALSNFGDTGIEGFHGGNYGLMYVMFLTARALGGPAGAQGLLPYAALWQVMVIGAIAVFVVWSKPTLVTGGLTLTLGHMLSYRHVWEHHASGAVLIAVFLLMRMHQDRSWPGRWIALACLVALALPTPFVLVDALNVRIYDPTPMWSATGRYILPLCKAIPELILCVLTLIQCNRERAGAHVAASEVSSAAPADAEGRELAL
jgi:hypothetical protein